MDQSSIASLTRAVQRYFDLCYDSDTARFDRIFLATAQLHGLHGGKLVMLPARAFKELVDSRPSLKSRKVPRLEQMLLVDFASPAQAFVKVRVRWDASIYVDCLTYHLVDGEWFITSKGFHVEQSDAPGQ